MNIRFLRLVPVLLCLVVLTWFLPKHYLRATMGERWSVTGQYSPITEDFIIWDSSPSGLVFRSTDGQKYSLLAARKRMPFVFCNDVLKRNGFPLTINGRSYSYQDAMKTHVFRLFPGKVFARSPKLHFLMESAPETAELYMPNSIMVIDEDKIRFIDCNTGKEKKEKSRIFTQKMIQSGVVFPIVLSATNSTPRKKSDEGMLLVDTEGKLFQLKQIKDAPFCRYLDHTFETRPIFINVDENTKKEYYGEVVTDKNVYLVSYKKGLIKLPLPSYNPRESVLKVWSKPVYHSLILKNVDKYTPTRLIALDESWKEKAALSEPCPKALAERKKWVAWGLSILSPFRLNQRLPYKPRMLLHIVPAPYFLLAAVFCVLWTLLYLFLTHRRYPALSWARQIRQQCLEIPIVLVTGLPGMLSLIVFGPLTGKLDFPAKRKINEGMEAPPKSTA